MSNPADWRSYVILSPDFNRAERVQMEAAMDYIGNASDGEGIDLLKAAVANNRGEMLTLAPAKDGRGSFALPMGGLAAADFKELRRLTVDENGQKRPLSLNGVLVHELYHLAQRPNNYENVHARIEAAIDRLDLKNYDIMDASTGLTLDAALRQEAHRFADAEVAGLAAARLRPLGETWKATLPDIPQTPMLDQYAPRFKASITDIVDYSKSIGDEHSPLLEAEATRFTDAFMAKNSGNAEPQRVDYDNCDPKGQRRSEITVLPSTGKEYDSPGYHAANADVRVTASDGVNNNPYGRDWRDYVTISDAFGTDRALLEQTLDAIAAAHDGEGIALLKEAMRTNNGEKVLIEPGDASRVSGTRIELSMRTIAMMHTDSEPHRVLGLGSTLVHELYHLAEGGGIDDPKIVDLVAGAAGKGINARALRNEAYGMISHMPTLVFMDILVLPEPLRQDIANEFAKDYPQFSKMLQSTTGEQWTRILTDNGAINAEKTPAAETRATLYADAFSQKNWGDQFPLRESYTNWRIIPTSQPLEAPQPSATPYPTAGFVSPLENLSIKPVAAGPAIANIRLPDVSSLRDCSTDGQQYCASDTGNLAALITNDKAKDGVVRH